MSVAPQGGVSLSEDSTSVKEEELSAADTVRAYRKLGSVEEAFRCLKTSDLHIRPVFHGHRLSGRVRAHVLLCMLSCCVEWHMRQALAPLLFDEEDLPRERAARDPVSPARKSARLPTERTPGKTRTASPYTVFEHS